MHVVFMISLAILFGFLSLTFILIFLFPSIAAVMRIALDY